MKATNALVAKEIRLLLPAWVAAMLLAIVPVWLLPYDPYYNVTPDKSPLFICAFLLGMVMLALSSFGREFGMKTFPLLLSLPSERPRAWRAKTGVLACAIITVYLAWAISSTPRLGFYSDPTPWLDKMAVGAVATAALVAGGLCMTLLVRQIAGAVWLTILVPAVMLVVIDLAGAPVWVEFTLLFAYAIAAFLLARWQFLNAQEVGWTGGTVALPGWRTHELAQAGLRSRRPLAALIKKEIKLHQLNLVAIAGLFLVHLIVVALRRYCGSMVGDTLRAGLDVFGGIWLLVPLLIGATSIAEERKLGTIQSNLTLPASRKLQFLIKLLFALLIGGLLSAFLLWTAESIATSLGVNKGIALMQAPFDEYALRTLLEIFLVWTVICVYASTLVNGLVSAVAASILVGGSVWAVAALIGWIEPFCEQNFTVVLWRGRLLLVVAGPALTLTFVILSYRNFKTISEGWRAWLGDLRILAAMLLVVCATTSFAYNRVWELVMPLEPNHGPSRMDGTTNPSLDAHVEPGVEERFNFLLPDGRFWTGTTGAAWFFSPGERPPESRFLSGSNWVDVVLNRVETVGVRKDGTLWVSERPDISWSLERGRWTSKWLPPSPLVQFGHETNWQGAAQWPDLSPLLIKRDGTLWEWSLTRPQNQDVSKDHWPWGGLRASEPRQLGTATNWARILSTRLYTYVWNVDGRAWTIHERYKHDSPTDVEIAPRTDATRVPVLDNLRLVSFYDGYQLKAGVTDDGCLWRMTASAAFFAAGQHPTLLDTNSDWKSVGGGGYSFVAIKSDGSLWRWTLDRLHPNRWGYVTWSNIETAPMSPTRVGRDNDWTAATGNMQLAMPLAAAADGSIWTWPDPYILNYGNTWLRQSRKPQFVANIFDDQPSP